jgi:hypothetical protein
MGNGFAGSLITGRGHAMASVDISWSIRSAVRAGSGGPGTSWIGLGGAGVPAVGDTCSAAKTPSHRARMTDVVITRRYRAVVLSNAYCPILYRALSNQSV